MRLLEVNVMNAIKLAKLARAHGSKKYFSVSTDKAANPVNLMGASKRIMEKFLFKEASGTKISMARFANVAFSDGSLLYGFQERLKKFQPFSCPSDVKRYFLTANEAGKLCLLSTILGNNNDIYFPNSSKEMNLISFPDIVHRYLDELGYKPLICASEDDARSKMSDAVSRGMWPVFYFTSDTTGEKPFEEFHTYTEQVELQKFKEIGVIKAKINFDENLLDRFMCQYESIKRSNSTWSKESIIKMYFDVLPELTYTDLNKYLDERM
jgi:FlaA1/EpsC-like NDP-sugar epimerase